MRTIAAINNKIETTLGPIDERTYIRYSCKKLSIEDDCIIRQNMQMSTLLEFALPLCNTQRCTSPPAVSIN
jgi:hypothetical protein